MLLRPANASRAVGCRRVREGRRSRKTRHVSCLEEAIVGCLVCGRRVAWRTTVVALVSTGCSARYGRSVACRGRHFMLAGELCLQRRDLTVEIGNLLVLGSVTGSGVDGMSFLRQHVGCDGGGSVASTIVVMTWLGVGESRRKGQSECGVGVHDAG